MNGCICVDSGELGVALSGGGARALAQVGVLKVLEREKIPVSHVAGTSAGAVIGAVFATSESAMEAEARVLAHLKTTGVGFNAETFATLSSERPRSYTRLWDLARRIWRMRRAGGALIGGEEMRNSLRVLLRGVSFEATRLPFATTALDPGTGRRMIFAAGSLVDGVYASSAIPGLVEPLALGEYLLVDGGWAEPVPVNTCRHLGAIHILAVDVGTPPPHEREASGVATAIRADALARDLLEQAQLREADFVLRAHVELRDFADFSAPQRAMAAGERAAEEALPEIAAVLERHRSLFVRTVN
jgi:NTE family protein